VLPRPGGASPLPRFPWPWLSPGRRAGGYSQGLPEEPGALRQDARVLDQGDAAVVLLDHPGQAVVELGVEGPEPDPVVPGLLEVLGVAAVVPLVLVGVEVRADPRAELGASGQAPEQAVFPEVPDVSRLPVLQFFLHDLNALHEVAGQGLPPSK
jgi:hypothetical protein